MLYKMLTYFEILPDSCDFAKFKCMLNALLTLCFLGAGKCLVVFIFGISACCVLWSDQYYTLLFGSTTLMSVTLIDLQSS